MSKTHENSLGQDKKEKILRIYSNPHLEPANISVVFFNGQKAKSLCFTVPKAEEQKPLGHDSQENFSGLEAPKAEEQEPLWHDSQENFSGLVDLADSVLNRFPKARIFSLGQSPAWIVKTAEMLSEARGEERTLGYIPFSARFLTEGSKRKQESKATVEVKGESYSLMERFEKCIGVDTFLNIASGRTGDERLISEEVEAAILEDFASAIQFDGKSYSMPGVKKVESLPKSLVITKDEFYIPPPKIPPQEDRMYYTESPRPENEAAYRDYLTSIGMNPDTIIQTFAEKGEKTAILEYTQSGESLASFASVLYGWAKSEEKLPQLKESLDICILAQDFCNLRSMNLVEQSISVGLIRHPVETGLIVPLANGKDHGPTSDRLVPKYPSWQWDLPPEPLMNGDHVNELTKRLQSEVVKQTKPRDIPEKTVLNPTLTQLSPTSPKER